jgi:parallel beta-helix repeat protein
MTRRDRRLRLAGLGIAAVVVALAPLALSAAASVSSATVWVVDNTAPNCLDTGPGTASQPFCTIAKGGQVAASGDTVLVRAGTYAGTSVNPTNSGVTFSANPGVTISGGSKAFAISNRSNVVISGFTISGTSSYGISVSGGSNVTISYNTESYAGTPIAGPASGIYLNNLAGGVVSHNVTHDNSAHGIYLNGSTTGVLVQGNTSYHNAYQYVRNANGIEDIAPGNSIIGNVTYDNEDSGINIYPGGNNALVSGNLSYHNGDHGIDDYNVTGGRITGNTIYYNCTTGINVEGTSGNYVLENNVSMNNATGAVINPTPIAINPSTGQPYYTNTCNRRTGNIGVWDSAPATSTANYNLVYQSNGTSPDYVWNGTTYNSQQALYTATGQEAQGIFADPLFANPGAGNFQLTGSSPAIDSADSLATGEQTLDILGNPRVDDALVPNTGNPAGSYYDRGAYEYLPSGSGIVASNETATTAGGVAVPVTLQGADTAACQLTFSVVTGPAHGTLGPITNNPCTSGSPNLDTASVTYTPSVGYQGTDSFTYTVSDGTSTSNTATVSITVTAATPPTAALAVTPNSGTAPLSVTADGSGTTAGSYPISTYSFAWGDGSATTGPQAAATASHTYSNAGSYTITLTVTDSGGLTATATSTVTVSPTGGGGSGNLVGNPGFETGLTGWNTSGSGSGVTLTQVSGGHSGSFAAALTNTTKSTSGCTLNDAPNWVAKTSAGIYTASLWVRSDDTGRTLNLRLREYSGSKLLGTSTNSIKLSTSWQQVTVTYTVPTAGTSLDLNAYTSKSSSPPGVCFYADDASIVLGTPTATPPTAALSVTPASGTAPLAVSANASASTQGTNPISSYTFAWGDGTANTGPQAAATATHTYTTGGTFTVTVTVTDSSGLTATATKTVTVTSTAVPPSAALSVTPASGTAPLQVSANASASTQGTNPISTYTFAWGDGTANTGPQPGATATHTYTSGGTFTVTVTVTDSGGLTATATKTVTVTSTVTNLVGNPGFETGLTGWNTSGSGSGVTLTQVSGGHSGTYAAALTNTSTGNSGCTLNDSPNWVNTTKAGTYTATVWVRADSAGRPVNVRFREYSGSTLVGTNTTTVTLSTSWQQVTVTYTVATAGTSLDFNVYTSTANSPPGVCFYADDVSITLG